MKPKHLIIVSLILVLILAGCVTSGPVKTEQILIPLTDKIFLEKHDQNGRSYHVATFTENAQYMAAQQQIFQLNGVQDVFIFPYQVVVKKSPLFKWETIEPEILRILKKIG